MKWKRIGRNRHFWELKNKGLPLSILLNVWVSVRPIQHAVWILILFHMRCYLVRLRDAFKPAVCKRMPVPVNARDTLRIHVIENLVSVAFCKLLVWVWIIFKADCTISTHLFLLRSEELSDSDHRSESLRSAQLPISYRCWLNKIKQYRMMPSRKTHTLGKPFEAWPERVPSLYA